MNIKFFLLKLQRTEFLTGIDDCGGNVSRGRS